MYLQVLGGLDDAGGSFGFAPDQNLYDEHGLGPINPAVVGRLLGTASENNQSEKNRIILLEEHAEQNIFKRIVFFLVDNSYSVLKNW